MFKRIMAATVAAFFLSVRTEIRQSVARYTRRLLAFVVSIVLLFVTLIFLNLLIILLVVLK